MVIQGISADQRHPNKTPPNPTELPTQLQYDVQSK